MTAGSSISTRSVAHLSLSVIIAFTLGLTTFSAFVLLFFRCLGASVGIIENIIAAPHVFRPATTEALAEMGHFHQRGQTGYSMQSGYSDLSMLPMSRRLRPPTGAHRPVTVQGVYYWEEADGGTTYDGGATYDGQATDYQTEHVDGGTDWSTRPITAPADARGTRSSFRTTAKAQQTAEGESKAGEIKTTVL